MKKIHLILFVLLLTVGCSSSDWTPHGVRDASPYYSAHWAKNVDPLHETGNLPIALHSPIIHEGVLYLGEESGYMSAYEVENGRTIWREYDGSAYHSSPLYFEESVIYGTAEGRVFARHFQTGELLYNIDLGASIETQASLHKGRIFLQLRNHKVFCLDAKTGKILWAYKRSIPYLTTIQRASKPVVHNNRLFVGFADGFVAAFTPDEGIIQWEKKIANGNKFIDIDTKPVVFKGKLLMGSISAPLTELNPSTGRVTRTFDYYVSRAPLVHGNKLILGTTDGEVVVLDGGMKELIRAKVSKNSISAMAVWKKSLAVATIGGELLNVDMVDLKVRERRHLGHVTSSVFGDLIVNEGKLALLSSRNRLYVFR